jgi:nuclear transport factor 2 (NTF2) superfamily protein
VQKNSTTLTMFIRYVFGSDRKRAHGYAYVLKAAISHGIRADGLEKFIFDEGGIEEIKRKMVASEKAIANKEKREKYTQYKYAEQQNDKEHPNERPDASFREIEITHGLAPQA